MRPISAKRAARLAAEGLLRWGSTFARTTATAKKPPRDTGPSREVRALIAARSGGWCELAGCSRRAIDVHHRLNRKSGGRHGEAAVRVNGAAWLLHVCRECHRWLTNPTGVDRQLCLDNGWVLLERQDAQQVPARLRHGIVLLENDGGMRTHDVA